MAELKGSKTENNLLEAFAGESQANRKYLAFADKADAEGHKQVAKLFRAAAAAETVHAHAHLRALGGIKGTAENLQEAVDGETFEFTSMYPQMIEAAGSEGFDAALRSFTLANTVEKVHAELYQTALDNLGSNQDVDYYVCKVCGNTLEGEPHGPCSVCQAGPVAFFKVG
ncbi:MAG: rubrerythrin family protein [Deltaproteobacteria bacterium]|nr:rubrerythrin family protein [Deltaproteobacteria bacterium]RLB66130.1 MAG: rubrerythrin family protein [Deltaproteobacteria bacterium]